jgi:hypothetical protein
MAAAGAVARPPNPAGNDVVAADKTALAAGITEQASSPAGGLDGSRSSEADADLIAAADGADKAGSAASDLTASAIETSASVQAQAGLSDAATNPLVGDRRTAGPAVRASHGLGDSGLPAHGVQFQPSAPGGETVGLAQGAHGILNGLRDQAGSASVSVSGKTGGSAGETFAALDAEAGRAASSWVHAGAHSAEAGFEDPALGWVGVRADLGAGGVHAAVVPGSAAAADALGGHMAGLNTYLREQHTPIETLTLASPGGRDSGAGQGMQQGQGQESGQGGSSGPGAGSSVVERVAQATIAVSERGRDATTSVSFAERTGGHISVVA